jgi:hypothetical protein
MSDEAHIIDIDSIVLTGVDQRNPGRLSDLIEAEVRRALEGTGLRTPQGIRNNETRVAGEVARTVVQSLQGGTDGV